jgi:SAM-dependent methyltransferase
MLPIERCFSCGGEDLLPFYEQPNIPVNNCLILESRCEAMAFPRGDLRLAFCRRCGFIQNVLFEAERLEYSGRYEESQGFSARFNQFQDEMVKRLVKQYDLRGKSILEIGCGKGDFLIALTRATRSHALAIDPSFAPERVPEDLAGQIDVIRDFYSESYLNLTADFIACRHTLEHIQPVADFVGTVRKAIGEQREPVVFFEVPDVLRVLNELAFWDIYYEHCSYFSLGSLARLFRAQGFDIFNLAADFDDQYLLVEAVASNGGDGPVWDSEHDLPDLKRQVVYFRDHHKAKLAEWGKSVRRVHHNGGKAVLWGSGSKAVSYINALGLQDEIEFVVDINPHRHGKYIIGGGQEVVAPEFLREYKPGLVVAMNNIYVDEIRRDLHALGVQAELTSV